MHYQCTQVQDGTLLPLSKAHGENYGYYAGEKERIFDVMTVNIIYIGIGTP